MEGEETVLPSTTVRKFTPERTTERRNPGLCGLQITGGKIEKRVESGTNTSKSDL
jgi:hypothetical protein